jgi:signal transduction histidine kinase
MSDSNSTKLLPVRPGAALTVVSLIAGILAFEVARECHQNLMLRGFHASFAPSLLYGCVIWLWWIPVTTLLWNFAARWPSVLKPSGRMIAAQLVISGALAAAHLLFIQHTVRFAAAEWSSWGDLYRTHQVDDPEHFGVEIVIYGFIYGICAFLYSRMQGQNAFVQKLEIERQLAEAQLKALQMQMEPHFLFNTLNAITSLVSQQKNDEAMETLAHLNTILRTTLQRRSPTKVPFTEELQLVESYLAIQKVRFADRIEIDIQTTSEARKGLVPSFLLQPLVENAVRHGIESKKSGGRIETRAEKLGDKLWMRVCDNGSGTSSTRSQGHGIGLNNIKERLAFFYPDMHQFEIESPPNGGYQVTIQIPFEEGPICN